MISRSWTKRESLSIIDTSVCESCRDASSNLSSHIHTSLLEIGGLAKHNKGESHSRIKVCARDITQCIDHAHERSCNRECGGWGFAEDVQSNCKNQHERSDEFACKLRYQCLFVGGGAVEVTRADNFVENCRQSAANKLEHHIEKAPTNTEVHARHINANGNSWIETSTRDRTCTIRAGNDTKADSKAIVIITFLLAICIFFTCDVFILGDGNVSNNKGKHEGVEKLAKTSREPTKSLSWCEVESMSKECEVGESCKNTRRNLHATINANFLPRHASSRFH
mmetsp:Transcript_62260/g.98719  ORF Transcript_62260/g.98719 Transcript_62260/m.98719 type:complete len:281 (-) Transcript_62260:310-1152(-)